jgi:hypothetical protein
MNLTLALYSKITLYSVAPGCKLSMIYHPQENIKVFTRLTDRKKEKETIIPIFNRFLFLKHSHQEIRL